MWAGTWRVGGVLAVSRAFGDKLLKQYVVADPEIKEEVVDSSLEFLILASDGLWDVVTNEEAVAMVKPIQDPQEASDKLQKERPRAINLKIRRKRLPMTKTPSCSCRITHSFLWLLYLMLEVDAARAPCAAVPQGKLTRPNRHPAPGWPSSQM
ncbi:unnamed protein product, partial [Urochloa humidicola]